MLQLEITFKMNIKESISRLLPELNDRFGYVITMNWRTPDARCLEPRHMTRECLVANANKNRMNRKAHLQDKVDVSMDKKQVDQQQQD